MKEFSSEVVESAVQKARFPDFLIIGAQRCGTTSLYEALVRHPQVQPAGRKEVNFFDLHHDQGLDWYRRFFPPVHLFPGLMTGEASPTYLPDPRVPRRVRDTFPDVKLVVLLRNPVERAWSQYHHNRRRGRVADRTFEEEIQEELVRLESGNDFAAELDWSSPQVRNRSYLTRGLYAPQIKRWMDAFPHEQIRIVFSERYFDRTGEVVGETGEFLGIALSAQAPQQWEPPGYPPPSCETRRRLFKLFRPWNCRLEELLKQRTGWA